MMTKFLGFFSYFTLLTVQIFSQSVSSVAVIDKLFPPLSAKVTGIVGDKLDSSYQNRILKQDVERLIEPFRSRTETSCWQSEFWGKWFTSAVLAYRYRPESLLKKKLDEAVNGLIATQTPDGYIGNYVDEKHLAAWDIWGRKYCMLGLLAYYDLTKDQKVLKVTKKVADHLINELKERNALIVKMGSHRGMAASSILEPICLLYSYTWEKKYLDFAEEIVREWETLEGPQLISKADIDVSKRFPKPKNDWYGWEQGQKAYEMMSCYEGLLELYRLTGKNIYKHAVEKIWENIRDTEINVVGSGSSMECWFDGKKLQTLPISDYQETCVTVTWIKLCQQLLRLTGDSKYADAMEQAYYNALLGAMKPDGSDWAKYSPLFGQRLVGNEQCHMGLNCCVANGPRGLFSFPLTAIMSNNEGLHVNFFSDGSYILQTPGKQKIELIQQTDYPLTGKIVFKVRLQNPEQMSLMVRIPKWSNKNSLIINGNPLNVITPGEYLKIERKWTNNDVLELNLDMRGRVLSIGEFPENVVIVRGPIVLARDVRLPAPVIDEIMKPVINKDGYVDLESEGQDDPRILMQFKAKFITESNTANGRKSISLVLCDYASAGNTYDKHSRFRTFLPQLFDPQRNINE
jgi:DUF1680 family protein